MRSELKIYFYGMKVPETILKIRSKKGSARFGALFTLVKESENTAYIRPYLVFRAIIVVRNLHGLESLKQLKDLKFFQYEKNLTMKFIDCSELNFGGRIEVVYLPYSTGGVK